MTDLQREREDLSTAEQHLAKGEQRIAEQIALIQRMTKQGYSTATAKDLLRLLEETMVLWQDHRHLILDTIARHERAISQSPQVGPRSKAL